MPHIRIFILASFLFLMCGLVSAKDPEPRLRVSPRIAINEGVYVEAFIPRHPANRLMRLEIDGPVGRAFEEAMDGADARAIYTLTWTISLPDGEYAVQLTVVHADGATVVKTSSFCRGTGCITEDQ